MKTLDKYIIIVLLVLLLKRDNFLSIFLVNLDRETREEDNQLCVTKPVLFLMNHYKFMIVPRRKFQKVIP